MQLGGVPRQARGAERVQAQPPGLRARAGPPGDHPRRPGPADRQEPAAREPAADQAADAGAPQGGAPARSPARPSIRPCSPGSPPGRRGRSPGSRSSRGSPSSRPRGRTSPTRRQALAVVAYDSNGGRRDVTRLALFKSNEEGLAAVDEDGRGDRPPARRDGRHGAAFRGRSPSTSSRPRTARRSTRRSTTRAVELHRRPRDGPAPRAAAGAVAPVRRRDVPAPGVARPDRGPARARGGRGVPGRPEPVEARGAGRPAARRARRTSTTGRSPGASCSRTGVERDGDKRGRKGVRGFARWLREQVETNRPWDEVVRDVLTARGPLSQEPAGGYFLVNRKPEDLAEAAVARLPRHADRVRQVPQPPARTVHAGRLLRHGRVLQPGQARRQGDRRGPGRRGRPARPPRAAGAGRRPTPQKVGLTQPRTGQFLPPRPLDRSDVAARPTARTRARRSPTG